MVKILILKIRVAQGREAEFESLVKSRAVTLATDGDHERTYLLRTRDGEYRLVSWWKKVDEADAWVRTQTYALSEDPQHRGVVVGPVPHEVLDVVDQY